jgi:sugar phosphate isomerase/epimerase
MRIGIDSYSFHRQFGEVYPEQSDLGERWSLEDFAEKTRELPAECISLETCFLAESDCTRVSQLFETGRDLMFAWGHPDGFMGLDEGAAVAEVTRYLQLSAEIGTSSLRVTGSSIKFFEEPHAPQIERTIRCLERLLPQAEKTRVGLALENHGDFYIHELNHILQDLDSPWLGIALDVGNCLRISDDPVAAAKSLGPKVFAVHAKDVRPMSGYTENDPRRLGCTPVGEGIADFPALLTELARHEFSGMVLVEISRMHPDYEQMTELQVVKQSLSYLLSTRQTVMDG